MLGALCILAIWVVLGACLCGVGLSLRRVAGFRTISRRGLFFAFWLGVALVIGLLQAWHLVLPMTPLALPVVVGLGIAGLAWNQGNLCRWLRAWAGTRSWGWLPCLGIALFAGYKATGWSVSIYETGLYHWNAVRFFSDYPAIPGLANLHLRLGFNNSGLLWSALLETGPLRRHSNHFSNGLLYLPLLLIALAEARRVLWRGRLDALGIFLLAACGLAVKDVGQGPLICSLSNDCQTGLALVSATAALVGLAAGGRRHRQNEMLLTAGILLTLAVCLKISSAFFAAAGWPLALILWRQGRENGSVDRVRALAWPGTVSIVLLLGWQARGLILSGYPLYPSALLGYPVSWRVPEDKVRNDEYWIRQWARWYGDVPPHAGPWDWLPSWWRRHAEGGLDQDVLLPVFLTLPGLLILAFRRRGREWALLACLVPPLVALAGWFLNAPDPRFASGSAWSLLGVTAAALAATLGDFWRRLAGYVILVVLIPAGLATAVLAGLPPAPPEGELFRLEPLGVVDPFVTNSGLLLWVPVDLLQHERVYDSPLPATPYPDKKLRLRVEGQIRWGFVIDP